MKEMETKATLWMTNLLQEIAEMAGDNTENVSYAVSAFLSVVAHHLAAGDAVGLRNIGRLQPTARGVEFSPSRSLLKKIRYQDPRSRK